MHDAAAAALGGPDVQRPLHNLSTFGISPHQAKVAAIIAFKPPKNVSGLRTQLGSVNYHFCLVLMMKSAPRRHEPPLEEGRIVDLRPRLINGAQWLESGLQPEGGIVLRPIATTSSLSCTRISPIEAWAQS